MIIKIKKHSHNFVIIDAEPLRNPLLSWRAKGLLAYLLTLPSEWVVVMRELQERSKDKRQSLQKAFGELRDHGHAVLVPVRGKDGKLKGNEWHILETPARVEKR